MSTNLGSVIRVGLLQKSVSTGASFLVADDIKRKQPEVAEENNLYPNVTYQAVYTVQMIASADGVLSVWAEDNTTPVAKTAEGGILTCLAGKMHTVTIIMDADWHINFRYSETTTLDMFVVLEHGGIY